ncbi:MAG: DoxX family protein, partial [Pseudomonadota bacterium]|nr:DoxX family protein [Pseudomonadota bacterium]
MTNVLDFIGRIFISALFLISGYNKVLNLEGSMGWMEGFGIPGFLIFPAIAVEIILPVLVIVGYQARIAGGILAVFCLMTAFLFHFDFSDQSQFISFLKNIGLAGGFLFIVVNGTKD